MIIFALSSKKFNEKTFLFIEVISIITLIALSKLTRFIYEVREALQIKVNIDLMKYSVSIFLLVINIIVFLKFIKNKKESSLQN